MCEHTTPSEPYSNLTVQGFSQLLVLSCTRRSAKHSLLPLLSPSVFLFVANFMATFLQSRWWWSWMSPKCHPKLIEQLVREDVSACFAKKFHCFYLQAHQRAALLLVYATLNSSSNSFVKMSVHVSPKSLIASISKLIRELLSSLFMLVINELVFAISVAHLQWSFVCSKL